MTSHEIEKNRKDRFLLFSVKDHEHDLLLVVLMGDILTTIKT